MDQISAFWTAVNLYIYRLYCWYIDLNIYIAATTLIAQRIWCKLDYTCNECERCVLIFAVFRYLLIVFISLILKKGILQIHELLTLPEHPSSPPPFSEDRVTRSFVLYVYFVDRCLSVCAFLLQLRCLFFFDVQIVIISIVSSSSS